ncbi:MAG: hypothetical protein ACPF8V_03020 [Luteibaculum sp.]
MKKSLWLCAAMAISILACKKEEKETTQPQPLPQEEALPALVLPCNLQGSDALVHADSVLVLSNRNDSVDYIINCYAKVRGGLVLEPGVTVQFGNDAGLYVYGYIDANGTADSNVVFTGEDKVPGSWGFISIGSTDIKNSLDYTVVEYAGGEATSSNGNKGNIVIQPGDYLSITNSTLRFSADYGLHVPYNESGLVFENNTLTGNKFPISLPCNMVRDLSSGDFSGNENDYIHVGTYGFGNSATIHSQEQHLWKDHGVPYRMYKTIRVTSGTLELQPGVEMVFENGLSLEVGENDNATLIANGTQQDSILFTGLIKAPAAWGGIYFEFTQSPLNSLNYCKIEYTGADGYDGAIYTWASAKASVTNTLFKDVAGCAIYFAPGVSNPNNNFYEENNSMLNVSGGYICGD